MKLSKKEFLDFYSKQAIDGDIAIFIGAGVSLTAGFPSWKQLLEEVYDQLNISPEIEQDLFLIAQYYANRHGYNALKKIVNDNINQVKHDSELIDALLNLIPSSIWTTNFDKSIENSLTKRKIPSNSVFSDKDLANIKENNMINIFKLNGDVSNLEKIVITKNDIEHYHINHELFLTFLKRELVTKTFLFIGYSFSDSLVLSALTLVNKYLGDSSCYHYTILKNDNSLKFDYFIEDLEKRYKIKCLVVDDYDEIPLILNELKDKINSKNVFISGVFQELNHSEDIIANDLCEKLTSKLFDKNFKIYTGYGRNLGNYICGNGVRILMEKNKKIEKNLIIRPFLKTMSHEEKKNHRKMLIDQCNVSIFMFGQSPQDGDYVNSTGMIKEFELAKEKGNIIIPIGMTGYSARLIWNEVKKNIIEYPYLEKYIDLLNSDDTNTVIESIFQILTDCGLK